MATGNLLRGIILGAAAAVGGTQAAADEAGCAALAERVTARVAAIAREQGLHPPEAGRAVRVGPAAGGPYTCKATAAVTSRAFGAALSGLTVRLTWNGDWLQPGDYCPSHYLDQCQPSQDRFSPLPQPAEFAFVSRAWRSVRRALGSQMPYGAGGDLSSFTDRSLDAALWSELRAAFGPGIHGGLRRETAGRR